MQLVDMLAQAAPINSCEVFLNDHCELRWRRDVGGNAGIWARGPKTSAFTRFKAGLVGTLPVESQLQSKV